MNDSKNEIHLYSHWKPIGYCLHLIDKSDFIFIQAVDLKFQNVFFCCCCFSFIFHLYIQHAVYNTMHWVWMLLFFIDAQSQPCEHLFFNKFRKNWKSTEFSSSHSFWFSCKWHSALTYIHQCLAWFPVFWENCY